MPHSDNYSGWWVQDRSGCTYDDDVLHAQSTIYPMKGY